MERGWKAGIKQTHRHGRSTANDDDGERLAIGDVRPVVRLGGWVLSRPFVSPLILFWSKLGKVSDSAAVECGEAQEDNR